MAGGMEGMPLALPGDAPGEVYDAEVDLLSRLIALRRRLAAEAGVPAYVVFADKTLKEMEEKRPKDLMALSRISGVGSVKLEKYGKQFLSVIGGPAA